jgi:hypothetical protein
MEMANEYIKNRTQKEWCAELDRHGAQASRIRLWWLWSVAPDLLAEETRHLFEYLINSTDEGTK